jgi:endoglycosylceramidase
MQLSPTHGLLALALTLLGVGPAAAQPRDPWDPALTGPVRVSGTRITDSLGRQVVLRGVNAGRKDGDFLPAHSKEDVQALVKSTGVNLVRLYVAWRALAPRPGAIDARYLAGVRERARRWSDAGVYVLIDMHQDVWGGPVTSHGAPNWATLGKGRALPLPADAPWQARYIDPRVWGSFEALWSNQVVPGTKRGLQDHYADAWVTLVRSLEGIERIVGYDLMNEPFMGAEVGRAVEDLLKKAAGPALVASGRAVASSSKRGALHGLVELVRRGPVNPLAPFFAARAGVRGFKKGIKRDLQAELMKLVRDPKQHHRILEALTRVNAGFERRLSSFYTRVGRRIRAVDRETAIFVEPMALVGIGVPSGLPRPALDRLVYAPHLYDAFVDSGLGFDGELERLRRTFLKHRLTAMRLRAPLFLGEWGHLDTLPKGAGRAKYATGAANTIEAAPGVGAAYWEHTPGAEKDGALDLVLRPYARRVAGRLLGGGTYDPATKTLRFRYRCAGGVAPTVVAAPARLFPRGVRLHATRHVTWRYLPKLGLVLIQPQTEGVLGVVISPQR